MFSETLTFEAAGCGGLTVTGFFVLMIWTRDLPFGDMDTILGL